MAVLGPRQIRHCPRLVNCRLRLSTSSAGGQQERRKHLDTQLLDPLLVPVELVPGELVRAELAQAARSSSSSSPCCHCKPAVLGAMGPTAD
eukprot:768489-Hanusia_phi.AAC.7